jgi:hypothetical protein
MKILTNLLETLIRPLLMGFMPIYDRQCPGIYLFIY